jgi:hypothetical protein
MSKNNLNFNANIDDFNLYTLTVNREMLNEIMNVLSNNNHVDVMVDKNGNISFDIPRESCIKVRSINVVQDLVELASYIDEENINITDEEEKIAFERKKEHVLTAIEIVSDIITVRNDDGGQSNVEQKNNT